MVARSLPKSLVAVGMLLLGLSQAWGSGYLTGYTDWQSLSPVAKAAYVAGASDYMTQLVAPSEPIQLAIVTTVPKCLGDAHTTDVDLARDVDRLYGDYLELRKQGTAVIVYLATVQRCQDSINQSLAEAGQKPLSFSTILHNLSQPP